MLTAVKDSADSTETYFTMTGTTEAEMTMKAPATIDTFDFSSSLFPTDPFSKFDMLYNQGLLGQQSSSPESFFSIMADIESSGTRTPSPKNEIYNSSTSTSSSLIRDDLFKTTNDSPFLYHHYQRKGLYPYDFDNTHLTSAHVFNLKNQNTDVDDIENLPVQTLKQQLKESIELVQKLQHQVNLTKIDNEKKLATIKALKTSLATKDIELKDHYYKLTSINQLCRAQTNKINENYAEISLYQTFIRSKGLDLPKINSGDIESSEYKLVDAELLEFDKSNHHIYYKSTYQNERKLATDNRRTLDKNTNANWDVLVERITKETDQQASIFMQQKLKSVSLDQKQLIFKAVLNQAYTLMTNRFGNFLVQRLFELGSPEQIQELAKEMKGHVLDLTCNPFGCHVVQKALEYVVESTKADLVSELLVQIPETIMHKHACHVWQKVFEIRWFASPPPIMKKIQEELKDQWVQVALDETGSLVIQNIFENLTESDKRPIINKVLNNAISIAKGQWGNWVIQHVLEQAEKSSDREAAFDFVLDEAVQLSMDQFASKVVEKALRIGGQQFITRFIQRICSTNVSNKPRIALVDIASDQYGNYVIQWLINNVSDDQKVYICRLIKRHMVSLRGSKYGQRVALLVEKILRNQEITTYPKE